MVSAEEAPSLISTLTQSRSVVDIYCARISKDTCLLVLIPEPPLCVRVRVRVRIRIHPYPCLCPRPHYIVETLYCRIVDDDFLSLTYLYSCLYVGLAGPSFGRVSM